MPDCFLTSCDLPAFLQPIAMRNCSALRDADHIGRPVNLSRLGSGLGVGQVAADRHAERTLELIESGVIVVAVLLLR